MISTLYRDRNASLAKTESRRCALRARARYTALGKQLTSPIGTSPEFLKRASERLSDRGQIQLPSSRISHSVEVVCLCYCLILFSQLYFKRIFFFIGTSFHAAEHIKKWRCVRFGAPHSGIHGLTVSNFSHYRA